jgi:hypothetical protein
MPEFQEVSTTTAAQTRLPVAVQPQPGKYLGARSVEEGVVKVTDTTWVSAADVLAGKVDLDALQGPYVILVASGISSWEENLIRAANQMAKFRWRACGFYEGRILMEKTAST